MHVPERRPTIDGYVIGTPRTEYQRGWNEGVEQLWRDEVEPLRALLHQRGAVDPWDALRRIRDELGVPGEGYPAPVANAARIAAEALDAEPSTTAGAVSADAERHNVYFPKLRISDEAVRGRDYDALAARVEQLEAALRKIDRLKDRWDAPLTHPVGDMSDPAYAGAAAWAAVGSEAHKIVKDALDA